MLPGPPEFGQRELIVRINQRGNGRVEFLLGDVMLVNPGDLPPVKGRESLRGLRRPQITAIAKRRCYIARLGGLQHGHPDPRAGQSSASNGASSVSVRMSRILTGSSRSAISRSRGLSPPGTGRAVRRRSTGSPSTSRTAVLVGKWASTVAARSANLCASAAQRRCCPRVVPGGCHRRRRSGIVLPRNQLHAIVGELRTARNAQVAGKQFGHHL